MLLRFSAIEGENVGHTPDTPVEGLCAGRLQPRSILRLVSAQRESARLMLTSSTELNLIWQPYRRATHRLQASRGGALTFTCCLNIHL